MAGEGMRRRRRKRRHRKLLREIEMCGDGFCELDQNKMKVASLKKKMSCIFKGPRIQKMTAVFSSIFLKSRSKSVVYLPKKKNVLFIYLVLPTSIYHRYRVRFVDKMYMAFRADNPGNGGHRSHFSSPWTFKIEGFLIVSPKRLNYDQ